MTDRIALTGITATGYHGVFEEEKRHGQPFVVDLILHTDISAAAAADDLTLTSDYGAVASVVHEQIQAGPYDLIETLTERIASRVLAEFALIRAVDVTVHKPKAPIPVPFGDVSITIHRDRGERT
ncbi:dihydroneopterin aldolase [Zhihengliuella flava]|uniref:7,8-dihydroneopterin aldolase n=1 Tax=Zhihengliuella flava TaxID=1285193 RepID=A0A931GEX3_9MICC|nr:dihydroneopterin aldolase [Zhihengliuella flava]